MQQLHLHIALATGEMHVLLFALLTFSHNQIYRMLGGAGFFAHSSSDTVLRRPPWWKAPQSLGRATVYRLGLWEACSRQRSTDDGQTARTERPDISPSQNSCCLTTRGPTSSSQVANQPQTLGPSAWSAAWSHPPTFPRVAVVPGPVQASRQTEETSVSCGIRSSSR